MTDDILGNLYKSRIRESEKLKTVLDFVQYGDSSEEKLDLFITGWRQWKKNRAKFTNEEWPETEIMKQAPWSRISSQNSVNKEV